MPPQAGDSEPRVKRTGPSLTQSSEVQDIKPPSKCSSPAKTPKSVSFSPHPDPTMFFDFTDANRQFCLAGIRYSDETGVPQCRVFNQQVYNLDSEWIGNVQSHCLLLNDKIGYFEKAFQDFQDPPLTVQFTTGEVWKLDQCHSKLDCGFACGGINESDVLEYTDGAIPSVPHTSSVKTTTEPKTSPLERSSSYLGRPVDGHFDPFSRTTSPSSLSPFACAQSFFLSSPLSQPDIELDRFLSSYLDFPCTNSSSSHHSSDSWWDYSTPTLELDMWDYALGADEMYEEAFSNREYHNKPEQKRRKCRVPPGFEGKSTRSNNIWGEKTPSFGDHASPPTSCGSGLNATRGILFSPCGRVHGNLWVTA